MRSISASRLRDLGGGDARLPRMHVLRQGGEDGAEIEELVLHAQQDGRQFAERGRPPESSTVARAAADEGVQFVHGAVGFDAQRVLGNALPADERGIAAVARAGCRRG